MNTFLVISGWIPFAFASSVFQSLLSSPMGKERIVKSTTRQHVWFPWKHLHQNMIVVRPVKYALQDEELKVVSALLERRHIFHSSLMFVRFVNRNTWVVKYHMS
jgi:hypothetical protein